MTIEREFKNVTISPVKDEPKSKDAEVKLDHIGTESDQPKTLYRNIVLFTKFIIRDIRWIQVIYHLGLIAASIYGIVRTLMLLARDIHGPMVLPLVYTWTFGE